MGRIRDHLAKKHGWQPATTTGSTHSVGCACHGWGTVPRQNPDTKRIERVPCPR